MPLLRDGSTASDPRLDRIPYFDPASRNYSVAETFTPGQQPVSVLWTLPPGSDILDQGQEGSCVGFGTTNELRYSPVPIPDLDAKFARQQIYWPAQRSDNMPGGSYPGATPAYEGTNVICGVKVAQKLGFYGSYHWAFSEADLATSLAIGPAILGVTWYSRMMRVTAGGYIAPTGTVAGGHCILCVGVNVTAGYYVLQNSWGPTWGVNRGCCKITRRDMARLLADQGEACIITQRLAPAVVPLVPYVT
jgi:hypothetical protein